MIKKNNRSIKLAEAPPRLYVYQHGRLVEVIEVKPKGQV